MNERSHSWIDDLKFAMAVGVIVEVVLVDGDRHRAGLQSVDEERGVILLAAPQGDPGPGTAP